MPSLLRLEPDSFSGVPCDPTVRVMPLFGNGPQDVCVIRTSYYAGRATGNIGGAWHAHAGRRAEKSMA